ncbi:hypothetical protein QJ48_30465 [Paenibacillus sp. A3]|uniref:head-tail connector protein n=1 Tax=Paenibacillus sp. A3 TaxID=1337054 RepID=UPI0006D53975|nr:head-tail connector protein [Paenibacillus sp. A3]KPV55916.1 hypothetical protein QJ48_30465 [Paenibacillus sp. A3]
MLTKFTEFDVAFAKQALRIEQDWTEDDIELAFFIEAARDFIRTHSQRTDAELDERPMASALVVKMVSDLYYGRSATGKVGFDVIFDNYLKLLRTFNI